MNRPPGDEFSSVKKEIDRARPNPESCAPELPCQDPVKLCHAFSATLNPSLRRFIVPADVGHGRINGF